MTGELAAGSAVRGGVVGVAEVGEADGFARLVR